MAEHERTTQKKQEEVDQKHRVRQQDPKSLFDQFHARGQGTLSIGETPFRPRMDEHAELLSMAHSDDDKANLVLHLQHIYGNRYVQRLLNSKVLQSKLTINTPNDIYEQEADRVADAVIRAEASQIQRQEVPEEEEEEEEPVQAKAAPGMHRQGLPKEELQAQQAQSQTTVVSESLETSINNARGSGQPLSDNVREPMEQALRADFSGVRVHTDSEADALNQKLGARAFTSGREIFFRQGEYNPSSSNGRKLLAHELTHVVQQSNGRVGGHGPGKTARPTIEEGAAGSEVQLQSETIDFQKRSALSPPRQEGVIQRDVTTGDYRLMTDFTTSGVRCRGYGAHLSALNWQVSAPHTSGYIVQYVTRSDGDSYTEAWPVKNGEVPDKGGPPSERNDTFWRGAVGKYPFWQRGEVWHTKGPLPKGVYKAGAVPAAGALLAKTGEADFGKAGGVRQAGADRDLTVEKGDNQYTVTDNRTGTVEADMRG